MSSVTSAGQRWAAPAEPVHTVPVGADDPVRQDSAQLRFWDPLAEVFGAVYVGTSPDLPGERRACVSISVAGRVIEIVEPLGEGTFSGATVDFDPTGRVTVDHPAVQVELVDTPLFAAAAYAPNPLVSAPGRPGGRGQQACAVEGVVRLDGDVIAAVGHGVRDRSWGFRSARASEVESVALCAVDSSRLVSATKYRAPDGAQWVEGFVIDAHGTTAVTGITVVRDVAAQFRRAHLVSADDVVHTVTMRSRVGGFWVPTGPAETRGPARGVYDDFLLLGDGDRCSGGLVEQATVHRIA
ncbi:MAG: hypothetical protein HOQ44_21015 [Nocardia sp.]|nr:hypothetical protein [Nocardia sp.]